MRKQQDGNVEERYRHVGHHPVFGRRARAGEASGSGGTRALRPPRRGTAGPRPVRPAALPAPAGPVQPRPVQPRPAQPRPAQLRPAQLRPAQPRAAQPHPALVETAGPGWGSTVVPLHPAGRVGARPAPHVVARRPVARPARRPIATRSGRGRFLVRRAAAGAVLVLAAALAVVAMGLLADAVSAARQPEGPTAGARTAAVLPLAPLGTPSGSASSPDAAPPAPVVTVDAPGTVWDVAARLAPGAGPGERAALVARIVTANSLASGEVRPGQVLVVPTR